MKKTTLNLFTILALITNAHGQGFNTNEFRIQRLEDQLTEVRRDQLNYKIEKELLEKNYSGNIQTTSTVVTVLFGVFAILGFFGLKDLSSIRKDFLSELDKLQDLRRDFEAKSNEFTQKQATVEGEYKELYERSEEQSKRIKVLEFREKISAIMNSGNYPWALENLTVALMLDPNNSGLLEQKASCLSNLGQLGNALPIYKQLFEQDPDRGSSLENYLECLLIVKQLDTYRDLVAKNRPKLETKYNGELIVYLHGFELYQSGDAETLRSHMIKFLGTTSQNKTKHLGTWIYNEVIGYLNSQPDKAEKALMVSLIDVFNGVSTPAEVIAKHNLT